MTAKPDLLIVGQVTIDDIVPPTPGPWRRQLGGSSLYAVAGARLWLEPERIGVVARVGTGFPFDPESLLRSAGLEHIALRSIPEEHLVEWLIYEPDGSRRSLPRNAGLLDNGAEGATSTPTASAVHTHHDKLASSTPTAALARHDKLLAIAPTAAQTHHDNLLTSTPTAVQAQHDRLLATSPTVAQAYHDKLLAIAPTAADVPAHWLPAAALHLCPQIRDRHRETLAAVRGRVDWISVDPSPHYSRNASIDDLARRLRGATALLPSENEVRRLLSEASPEEVVRGLERAGFVEVALKRGAQPVLLAYRGALAVIPTPPAALVDPTGAGDAFCGAYAACRLQGLAPIEAARRAAATAALVVGCSGVEAALRLATPALQSFESPESV
jgi:hypothetical protein